MSPSASKAILITGCSTGIGRATAQRLARAGRTVYATARSVDAIADLERDGCKLLALDVCDEASMTAAVRAIESAEGAVGALVNNAGYSQSGPIEDVPIDLVRKQFETNVFGLVRLTQLVLPGMRAQRDGRIVNISSMGANFTFPGGGYYHATKYALEAISDALRFEVAGFGVKVVVIQPGLIKTNFGERAVAELPEAQGDGPYAGFTEKVAQATRDVYEEGAMAKLGSGPDSVAKVIEKAIDADKPKARYRVTPSAHAMIALRAVTPDRGWDAIMRGQFPQPGKS
ncbi:SDR family NAD(P)-dependent oxidoreductase [Svornostia abyssi]|uniref:SDR family NAD(P)-dependent oxidoreductase n=1 Tax=Svornostia abyssi TaxID=2898438 RepID=A0ABY5PEL7_9ACTN|nr:SDR family NAD(P)-dependent oxidoreductase [Parviterribacteraceae bacterium J379]